MKRLPVHILALAVALFCLSACSGGKDRIIPRGKLSRIYEELYLADKWADSKQDYRTQADTTDFYETIFKSYGYTTADYRASVEYYLNDPERFSRILKKTAARLTAKSKELDKSADRIQEILQMLERAKETAPTYTSLTDMTLDSLMSAVFSVPTFNFEGRVEADSEADSTRTDSLKVGVMTPVQEADGTQLKQITRPRAVPSQEPERTISEKDN